MRQIVVSIDTDGKVEIKAVGFKGNACEKATAALEKALGMANATRKKLPEYYASETANQKVGGGL